MLAWCKGFVHPTSCCRDTSLAASDGHMWGLGPLKHLVALEGGLSQGDSATSVLMPCCNHHSSRLWRERSKRSCNVKLLKAQHAARALAELPLDIFPHPGHGAKGPDGNSIMAANHSEGDGDSSAWLA